MLTETPVFSAQTSRPKCMEPGCPEDADCLPKLLVPAHVVVRPLSKFDYVSSVMGLPMCFKHMRLLKPEHFLRSPEVRASIERDFRKHGSLADFQHASLSYVRKAEPEFQNWMDLQRLHKTVSA